jgi:type III restriction enzyme
MPYLHEIFNNPFARKELAQVNIPYWISDNLKPGFGKRPYQEEAFKRYLYLDENDFDGKPGKPYHLLYNMATGSGKTLIMAGLVLHLFQKGYRNFLFFVNSNNIIQKTKDNFLNPQASKYLFSNKIVIDGKEVLIKEIDNFEEADQENVNIKFTTIQQLHIDLNNTKENSITFEDFQNKKFALIADEAHHLVAGTKAGNLFGTWEDTVQKIHSASEDNILLEFTATIDSNTAELINHYQDKVLFKYDLSEFRKDKYSKEINLVRSDFEQDERILQALVLNLYRQELATTQNMNLKPVILFKSKKTIAESELNKQNFHKLIDDLSESMLQNLERTSTISIVKKAFQFFESNNILNRELVIRLQSHFKPENCLSANNDAEAEKNQILLNTLEDENNPIRAIFAVQKLNEGWDVLNLFDIVRLYEGRDSQNGRPGKTTIAEAQLIGRGARYFPFILEEGQDAYTRKFDTDVSNDLKILEELYYHTKEDSRYISELKAALIETGIYDDDDNMFTTEFKLKDSFKQTQLYKSGIVFYNNKIPKTYENISSFLDLGVSKTNYHHKLSSGLGKISNVFLEQESAPYSNENNHLKDYKVSELGINLVRYALTQNPFFYFNNLIRFFPHIKSLSDFIRSESYLGSLSITLEGSRERLQSISSFDYLNAIKGLLESIEQEIKNNSTEYEGSTFIHEYIQKVFKDKTIKVLRDTSVARGQSQEEIVGSAEWYAYNCNYGTIEEKKFVELFSRRFEGFQEKFENIYLLRNEREIKIHDKFGRAFEPDFLLFCKEKLGSHFTYQVFIEPKGMHLKGFDKWKEDFLLDIQSEARTIKIHTDEYRITAVPFYNYESENDFSNNLDRTLNQI